MRKPVRLRAAAFAVVSAVAAVSLHAAATAAAAATTLPDDFNGDGYRDLVIGDPSAKVGGHEAAGAVTVVYGSKTGPNPRTRAVIHQDSAGVPGAAEPYDLFGSAFAGADLNRDGFTDLVVGSSGEKVGSAAGGGAVTILWGSSSGLRGGTSLASPAAAHSSWGNTVAVGDFDGNGVTDVASQTDVNAFVVSGPFAPSGAHGAVKGLIPASTAAFVDRIVAGQVAGDRATDLVVLGMFNGAWQSQGRVYRGRAGGPVYAGTVVVDAKDPNTGRAYSAAIGDFDHNGYGDLAVGKPQHRDRRGSVVVFYGAAGGLGTGRASAVLTQDTAGVPGAAEPVDLFGFSLAAGDTTGDGYADLAVGAPCEGIGTVRCAGTVTLLKGGAGGLTGAGSQVLSQNTTNVAGAPETDDQFGGGVRIADLVPGGRRELAVSVPGDYVSNTRRGIVHILRGNATGVTGTGSSLLTPVQLSLPLPHLGPVLQG